MNFASRRSPKTFTVAGVAGALTVAGGEPVNVYGIEFQAVTAAIFTVTDASNTTLWTFSLPANQSTCVEIPWVADAGIKVQTNQTDGSVCVFHNNPGR